jgi:hypothetical protein
VIRLVRVEMLRLFSRRLLKLAVIGVLLLVTTIVVIDAFNHTKNSSVEFAQFKAKRLAQYDKFRAENPQPPGQEFRPTREEVAQNPANFCFGSPGPQTQDPCGGRPPKSPYITRDKLPDFGKAVAVICAFAAFLIGASAAGAEWSAGTMQSLLFWEPRRVRVVLAKVAGLVTVIAIVVVLAEALFGAGALIAGQLRGTTSGVTSGVWTSFLLLALRGIAFAGFATVLGFSIAFGTRITAAAVGIAFIYFAILERLLVVWKLWLGQYTIGTLLAGWLNNGIHTEIDQGKVLAITGTRAGTTLAIYALVMLTVATVWFRQRDVT